MLCHNPGILIFTGAVIIVCAAMFSDPPAGMNPGPLDPHNVFPQRAPLGFMRAADVLQDDYPRDGAFCLPLVSKGVSVFGRQPLINVCLLRQGVQH